MTEVQAHRGLSADEPENTLAAFRAAAAAGFDGIELDVRLTHDGEVVCLHDGSVARTTDGTGRVADLDYDELRQYDTGNGPVPRLADAMRALKDDGLWWNVEVKAEAAALPALDVIQHHAPDTASLSCMDPYILKALRRADDEVQLELITLGPPDQDDYMAAVDLECRGLNVDQEFLDGAVVDAAREQGLRLMAWTVNDPGHAKELHRLGVDGIITDTRDVLHALR